ncbi:unnamed protein product [Ilex paraguariensis]|uniref:Uncharacterized protein n=1 Tax=Ilex paraguariensis TaxID=185542 RepID=A0ABC8U8W3_9AQUA
MAEKKNIMPSLQVIHCLICGINLRAPCHGAANGIKSAINLNLSIEYSPLIGVEALLYLEQAGLPMTKHKIDEIKLLHGHEILDDGFMLELNVTNSQAWGLVAVVGTRCLTMPMGEMGIW